jgi:VanZ family protein
LTSAHKQQLKAWIAALLWLGLIAGESTTVGSASNTRRILYPLLHFVVGLDRLRFETWHFYIRKSGHFIGYFMLSWLLFRAWKVTLPFVSAGWSIQWARIALFMTALVACLDEWHQTYLPSRAGALHDVLLDSSAAFVAQTVIFLWFYVKDRSQRSAAPQF